jgi:hypothetical protein
MWAARFVHSPQLPSASTAALRARVQRGLAPIASLLQLLLLAACMAEPPEASSNRVSAPDCTAWSRNLESVAKYSLVVSGASGDLVFATLRPDGFELSIGFRPYHTDPAQLELCPCDDTDEVRDLFLSSASLFDGSAVHSEALFIDPNEKVLNCSVALVVHSPVGYEISYIRDEVQLERFLDTFNRLLARCESGVELRSSESPILYVEPVQSNA